MKEQRAGSTQFAVKAKLAQPNLITKTLIGINLAVFVYGLTLRSVSGSGRLTSLDVDFALFAPNVANGEWYRIVTSGFLHSGFLHVAMNMYALWVLGAAIESMVGRVRFLGIYIVALFGGSAGALALDALQNTPRLTVGASGAIYGLFGALAVALHRSGRSIFASGGGRFQFGIGEILVLNLVLTLTVPGISIGGHLG
ncbi:MAG: rhomboid family intramembrane serine protease, partial [Acidimicrobiia bacterium]